MQAQFIVVEGIEGAGKSTVISHIKEYLIKKDIEFILTREPGGTDMAENIRGILKQQYHNEQVYPETEVLLLYAARLQLVNNIIKPALAANKWVIADRHDLSTIAYQSGGRGLSESFLKQIKQSVLGDFTFDFCLYLDIEPQLGLERARGRGELDRFEQEQISFFDRIRQKYLELVELDSKTNKKIKIIDASLSETDVKNKIVHELINKYG